MSQSKPIFLALGSNLGDRAKALREAIHRLDEAMTVETLSRVYETAPMYVTDQPAFLNMVLGGRTRLEPLELLDFVKRLEIEIGRVPSVRNGPRAIDIDILFHGETVLDHPRLTLPHPRIAERAFVLVPLADIAADLPLDPTGRTVSTTLQSVQGREEIQAVEISGLADFGGVPR